MLQSLSKKECWKKKHWTLVWNDEFDDEQSIDAKWNAQNSAVGNLLCSRWRENAIVKRKALRIVNKKQSRGGQEWTSASLTSKEKFKYGYFECRMKISKSSGINNSFWFFSYPKGNEEAFELDVVEAHFPNWIQTNIHDWGNRSHSFHKQKPKAFIPKVNNLFNEYHIYGILWTEEKINFYFDGEMIRTEKNTFCHSFASVVLGCAIMNWAGNVMDKIDGTFMEVDYVRAFK